MRRIIITAFLLCLVTKSFTQEKSKANEPVSASCTLGKINTEILPDALTGTFHTEGRIVFDKIPKYPWEFMATGTGRTGLTVTIDNGIRIQLSHEGALDEYANLRTLGILNMDFQYTSPIEKNDSFLMEHDLRKSEIQIKTINQDNIFSCKIWAHPGMDVIAIVIENNEPLPEEFNVSLLKDYAFQDEVNSEGVYLNWHENSGSVFEKTSKASAVSFQQGDDILQNRCFGTAISVETEQDLVAMEKKFNSGLFPVWTSGLFSMNYAKRVVIWIAGESVRNGKTEWEEKVIRKLNEAKSMGLNRFIESHHAWWREFWAKSYYQPVNQEKYIHQIASYNLYRYYMACSSSSDREFPVRFQNDLFRYQIKNHLWSVMDIHAIETYQVNYGAVRTGDINALYPRVNHYQKILPAIKEASASRFNHDGAISLYESNLWGTYLHNQGQPTRYTEEISPYLRYSWQGNLWMIYLMCDYYALTNNKEFADNTIKNYSREVISFYKNHFPEKDSHNRRIFYPASGGETWIGAKNPTEIVAAMKATLPRVLEIGKTNKWEKELLSEWKLFLKEIPDIPRGKLVIEESGKSSIEPGDLYVPAEDLSLIDTGRHLNRQHIELLPVWPGKLVLRNSEERIRATETFYARYWKERNDGWNLDAVFMACLGQYDSLMTDYPRRFYTTHTFPCGLARESSPFQPVNDWIPYYPSMQGMGTTVIPVFEQLIQDYPDEIILFPCWKKEDGISFRIFSPYAGWIEVVYEPDETFKITTDKKIKITLPEWLKSKNG
ncbi:MAG: DUF5703 domain-containing protein [Bacteroidota bacterium]